MIYKYRNIISVIVATIVLSGIMMCIFGYWSIKYFFFYIPLILLFLLWFAIVIHSLYYALQSIDSNSNIKILSALGVIATPFIIGYIGWQIQFTIKEKDIDLANRNLDLAYIGIATSILQGKDINKDTNNEYLKDLRKWAFEILKQKSPIPFGQSVEEGFISGSLILPSLLNLGDYGYYI